MSRFTDTATKQEPKFTVTVSGDIAGYSKGDVLTKPNDIADYLHECFDVGSKDTLALEDEEIIAIAMSIPHTETMSDEDWEIEVLEALDSQNRSNATDAMNPLDPITSPLPDMRSPEVQQAAMGSIAASEGERLDRNERFRTELHTAGDAPIKVKRAALEILRAMLQEYGYKILPNGELADWHGHLDMFPKPGTHPKKSDGGIDRQWNAKTTEKNKYAEYYITVGTERVKYDWYKALVEATAEGKALAKEYDLYNDAKLTSTHKPSPDNPYQKNTDAWLDSQKRSCNDRLKGMIRAFKSAIDCYYQMQAINEDVVLCNTVGARFLFQHNNRSGNNFEAISDGVQPIELWDKITLGRCISYTVSGFNNLDIETALDKGGDFNGLVNSTARGSNDVKNNTAVSWTDDIYLNNYSHLSEFLNTPKVNWLMTQANAKDKDGQRTQEAENIIVQHCQLFEHLTPFYNLFSGEIRQRIIAKRTRASEKLAKEFEPRPVKKAS